MTPFHILIAACLFPVLLFVIDTVREIRYRRLSAKNGCKPPRYISSFPLGIRSLLRIDKAHKKNEFYEYTRDMIGLVGKRTFRHQTIGGVPVITIEPENIKAVLATQFKEFDLGGRHAEFQPFMGDGIFTLSGEGWHHSRTLLRPQFTNEQVSRLNDIESHTQTLLKIFKESSMPANTGDGKAAPVPFDVQPYFFKLTLDTATEFLFGESTETLSLGRKSDARLLKTEEFANAFNTGQTWLLYRAIAQSLHPIVTGKEFKTCAKICHDFVDGYVNRALDNATKRDNDEKSADDQAAERYIFLDELTKETRDPVLMRDQALNILLAGRDTTAGLLTFTFSLLVRHKDVWAKLREAVLNDFGTTTDNISFQTLKRCEYLKHVVNEVLRLYPIVPVNSRQANCNTTLPRGGGPDEMDPIFIEKGMRVQYSTYALQRNEEFWGEDSEKFRPERWMEGKRVTPWTYIPFNGGPRICLGQQFALTEASYVIVRIVQTFSDVYSTPDVEQSEIKQYANLTASVAGGAPMIFKE